MLVFNTVSQNDEADKPHSEVKECTMAFILSVLLPSRPHERSETNSDKEKILQALL